MIVSLEDGGLAEEGDEFGEGVSFGSGFDDVEKGEGQGGDRDGVAVAEAEDGVEVVGEEADFAGGGAVDGVVRRRGR